MQERGIAASDLIMQWKLSIQKWLLWAPSDPIRTLQGHTPLWCHLHLGPAGWRVCFSLHSGKGNCCMWLANEVEIVYPKIGFLDSNYPIKTPQHPVLPRGKKSDINFYFIENFQSFVPKNTLYHNRIITFYHFEPLPPANLKWFKLDFPHFTLLH